MADDNPPGISQYYGISFKTGSGMIYKISNDGKLVTNLRHHLKGEDVMAITGVSQDNYAKAFDLVREVPSDLEEYQVNQINDILMGCILNNLKPTKKPLN